MKEIIENNEGKEFPVTFLFLREKEKEQQTDVISRCTDSDVHNCKLHLVNHLFKPISKLDWIDEMSINLFNQKFTKQND